MSAINVCSTNIQERRDNLNDSTLPAMACPVVDEKPKRPLSAYNFFFQSERRKLLANRPVRPEGAPRHGHGKMGFADMARTIASKWNKIDCVSKKEYEDLAKVEKLRYKTRLAEWKTRRKPTTTLNEKQSPSYLAASSSVFTFPSCGPSVPGSRYRAHEQGCHSTYQTTQEYPSTGIDTSSFASVDSGDRIHTSSLFDSGQHSSSSINNGNQYSGAPSQTTNSIEQGGACLLTLGIDRLAHRLGDETITIFLDLFQDS